MLVALGMLATACGGSSDSTTTETPASSDSDEEMSDDEMSDDEMSDDEMSDDEMSDDEMADDEGAGHSATSGQVEIAAGTSLDLDACPDDWEATTGVDGDEIRIGISLPQSGALAAFGPIADGMEAYFDYINENDPIDGKELVLISRDDAYEAGRTVANVEEMIDIDEIFAFAYMVGSPNNAAARPILNEACVPQAFAATGLPIWGDPANFPWTLGGLLAYNTEASVWCDNIVAEAGEGATVAALFMNNDFGKSYQVGIEECAAAGKIDLVANEVHEATAPDIQNEITSMIATEADAFIFGSTGAFCPQSAAGVAGSSWRPLFYVSNTCSNLAAFFAPVQEQAGLLADEGAAVRMASNVKNFTDPVYADDPAIILGKQILDDAGLSDVGSQTTGVLFAYNLEQVLREAAASGELNRVSFQQAMWNQNSPNPYLLDGVEVITDGVNDAYAVEGARIEQIVVNDGALSFEAISELISVEGQTGAWGG